MHSAHGILPETAAQALVRASNLYRTRIASAFAVGNGEFVNAGSGPPFVFFARRAFADKRRARKPKQFFRIGIGGRAQNDGAARGIGGAEHVFGMFERRTYFRRIAAFV